MKERLKKEYRRRLRELNARNKMTAIGALAVPVLRYNFGIINRRIEEIKQIDRKTRKMLTIYKMHHPRGKEEGKDCYKLKQHIKQRLLILQNTLTQSTKKTSLLTMLKSMRARNQI
jgi:hypothetical protein